jgi:hypothetical protein
MSDIIDPQKAVDALITMAPKHAEAKANRIYLEEYRKSLKAILMKQHQGIPIAAQEREAYAHPDYLAHLQAMQTAVMDEEVLRWRMVAAQARIEVWRSQNANNRGQERATR